MELFGDDSLGLLLLGLQDGGVHEGYLEIIHAFGLVFEMVG